jgi:3D (Asp-Asp-Asp) domain-containing protein
MQFKTKAIVMAMMSLTLLMPPLHMTNANANNSKEPIQIEQTSVKKSDKVLLTPQANVKKSITANMTCLGTFKITAFNFYEGGGENYQTASGRTPEPYKTIAVDTSIISLGTKVYISGLGWCRADDTGSAIQGNIIDYHIGYDDCDSFGIQYHKVYVAK